MLLSHLVQDQLHERLVVFIGVHLILGLHCTLLTVLAKVIAEEGRYET